ncbi:MAG: Acyl-phosphate:glycerol-3-phosphate O-acyltransferase PlsY [Bacillales bacterium]|jgi:glycerol-3-phosphate acyltransferase PlsY|nr:Acyl-phosphate:glycerol-3-phosphate O-acyltransferase PlsY [Bacillales bacterium]
MEILLLLLAYILGAIPSGLIIGKIFYNKDIREYGSGNLGATNTFRTLGKKAGFVVSIMDVLKGSLAVLLPIFLGTDVINPLFLGVIAVIGHMYPIFAGFRGGKAVATSAGVLLAHNPLLILFMAFLFFGTLKLTKYVSLSSIVTVIAAFLYTIIDYLFFKGSLQTIYFVLILGIFIVFRHRSNIKRIQQKIEPKVTWI